MSGRHPAARRSPSTCWSQEAIRFQLAGIRDTLPIMVVWMLTWIGLLLRFGLLAASVGFFVYDLLYVFPITTELQSWKAGPTLLVLPLLALLCVTAFRNAVGGTGLRRYLAPELSSRP